MIVINNLQHAKEVYRLIVKEVVRLARNAPVLKAAHLRLIFILGIFISASLQYPRAQVIDPITAAQAPVPGAGHSYLGIGTETVNPADGSVSFDLPIQTPAGRGISFPFAISYYSSAPFFVTGVNSGTWTTSLANGSGTPFDLNGWSYELPHYTTQAFVSSTQMQMSGCTPFENCGTDYCWSTQDMSFVGFDGQNHPVPLIYSWPALGNPDPSPPNGESGGYPYFTCGSGPGGTGLLGGGGYGDYGSVADWGTPTYNVTYPTTQPPVAITDRSGIVYQFAAGPMLAQDPSQFPTVPFGVLASSITDRNGNQITLNAQNNSIYETQSVPPGSYTDTLGRPVVSWTGLGGSSGDQLTVAGLGTITVKWTTTTVTFPTTYTSPVPSGSGATQCAFSASPITMRVVSEIDLPNNHKYSFSYGGQWGLLTRITFPDGGYVNYTWGASPLSTAAYVSWPLALQQPGSTGNAYCYLIVDTPAITERDVSYDGSTTALTQSFQYNPTSWVETGFQQIYWSTKSTQVTTVDKLTNQTSITSYTYSSVSGGGYDTQTWHSGGQIPVESSVTYEDGAGTALRTINKTWADRYSWIANQTIPNDDATHGSTIIHCLDNFDQILAVYEYDFAANGGTPSYPGSNSCRGNPTVQSGLNSAAIGGLMRHTVTAYTNLFPAHILDMPSSVTICDGSVAIGSCTSANAATQTTYSYDQGTLEASEATVGLVAAPGGASRGNPTTVSRSGGSGTSTTTYSYYDSGQLYKMTDPCGNSTCADMSGSKHTTTYSYTDNFAAGTGTPPGTPASQTNAYLTEVINPLGAVDAFTWGYNDGQVRSHTNPNQQTTAYSYGTKATGCNFDDYLDRLTEIVGPADPNNGGSHPTTTYCYNDSSPNPSVTASELLNTSGTWRTTVATRDGMGHTVQTQSSDPSGDDYVDIVYDGEGRIYKESNPTRCSSSPGILPSNCSESSWGLTARLYDALGRLTSVVNPDNTSRTSSYNGPSVTLTDEKASKWISTYNGLGELEEVDEPNPANAAGASLKTTYGYTVLGDLTAVNQIGNGSDSARARSFQYDGLSRLLSASNPETGTVSYDYDANGNVSDKIDARGVKVSYQYDALNRILAKTFGGNAPAGALSSCYMYDNAATGANGIGRLWSEWTQSSCPSTAPSSPPTNGYQSERVLGYYDAAGRLLGEKQCVLGFCTSSVPPQPQSNCAASGLAYCYDLAGDKTAYTNGLTSASFPQQSMLFMQAFDTTGRLASVGGQAGGSQNPTCLFNAQTGTATSNGCTQAPAQPTYSPFGGLQSWSLGTNISVTSSYDTRLRLSVEAATGQVPQ